MPSRDSKSRKPSSPVTDRQIPPSLSGAVRKAERRVRRLLRGHATIGSFLRDGDNSNMDVFARADFATKVVNAKTELLVAHEALLAWLQARH